MKKEIQVGGAYPFYQIPIGAIINYGMFGKIKEYEKVSKDTIKKEDDIIKMHITNGKYEVRKLPCT